MIKKFLFLACLFFSIIAFSQEGTSSPYSFYGIGDVRFKGTQDVRSMGGLGVLKDSIHINLENPASYTGLVQTTFTIGGTYSTTQLKNSSKTENASRSSFDYLAVGLPIGKFGVGFGLMPYSSVGYKIQEAGTTTTGSRIFDGKGGLNKFFVGLGYQVTPKISVGADLNYNFGTITINKLEGFVDIQSQTSTTTTSYLSGVNFNLGSMYQTKIDKKRILYTALTLGFGSTLNSDNSKVEYTDTDIIPTTTLTTAALKIPTKITFGVGIGQPRKWLLGTQVSYRGAGNLTNSYNQDGKAAYGRYGKVSLGGYFIPDYNSFTSYFKRIVYRAGFKYEKTGLVVSGQSINDVGLNLGLELPITQSLSNFNIGFEIGKRGTTNAGLIKENYANLSLSFSLNDKWFVRRKFN
jgi:hypothetical protein